jgi:ABC-type Mn2+/Zn2+ transport system permease subunit/Mn-dependent DtxR family transcriptional regulator
METLADLFIEPLLQPSNQRALLGGSLVAIVCGVVGCYVILRRMAFLGDALAHAMLAGVTAGYLFMQIMFGEEAHAMAMLIGSLIAGFTTVLLIGIVSRISRIKEDTAIGIMYTGIFAFGALLASYFSDRIHIDLYHFVIGSVLSISDSELWLMGWVTAVVLALVILFYRQLQITSFDPVMAASLGISVLAYNYLLTACTSLVVVAAVPLVGVILVVGLLVTPAATAYLICDRLSRMQLLSAMFGVTSVLGGFYVSNWVGTISTGPTIVFFSTLQFLFVLLVAPRYGFLANWMRRRSAVPQEVLEDVLGCLRKAKGERAPLATIQQYVQVPPAQLGRAINWLEGEKLITADDGFYSLTPAGGREARRLLRSHRLWEAYLKQVGTPEAELHKKAHLLEHLHDEETVDYLDDKLGHPLTDPHGSEIPEDFVHLVPGTVVKAALLREGHSGTIEDILYNLSGPSITKGGHITVGPRKENGTIWTLRLADGRWMELDHGAADSVLVRLDEHGQPQEREKTTPKS